MEGNFTQISNEMMSKICIELTGNELKVMLCLLKWYNQKRQFSSPKQKDIAEFTGIKNINHISESIQKLIEKKFIVRQRTAFGNIYYITEYYVPDKFAKVEDENKEVETKKVEVKKIMVRNLKKTAKSTDKKMNGPKFHLPKAKGNTQSDAELRKQLEKLNEDFMTTFDDSILVKIDNIKSILAYRQSEEYEMDKLEMKGR